LEVNAFANEVKNNMREKTSSQLYQAGAHYVIDGIWDLPKILEDIEFRLTRGEYP